MTRIWRRQVGRAIERHTGAGDVGASLQFVNQITGVGVARRHEHHAWTFAARHIDHRREDVAGHVEATGGVAANVVVTGDAGSAAGEIVDCRISWLTLLNVGDNFGDGPAILSGTSNWQT